jgi:hypothetical protein
MLNEISLCPGARFSDRAVVLFGSADENTLAA